MKVVVRVPWRAGSAWNSGAWSTVKLGAKSSSRVERGADEHVADERHVPRVGRHVAHREAERRVGAAVEILDEQLVAAVEVGADVAEQGVEVLGGEGLVDLAPIDVPLGGRLADDELVPGRAAGVRGGDGDERAHVGELSFAALDGALDELRRHEVPVHGAARGQAQRLERGAGGRRRACGHAKPSKGRVEWGAPPCARACRCGSAPGRRPRPRRPC